MLLKIITDTVSPRYFWRSIKGNLRKGSQRIEITDGSKRLIAEEARGRLTISVYADSGAFGVARDWRLIYGRDNATHQREEIAGALVEAFDLLTHVEVL